MEGWLWMCLGQHLLGFILLYSSIILPAWCRPAISSCSTGMIMLGPRCWSQQFRTSYTTATAQLSSTTPANNHQELYQGYNTIHCPPTQSILENIYAEEERGAGLHPTLNTQHLTRPDTTLLNSRIRG